MLVDSIAQNRRQIKQKQIAVPVIKSLTNNSIHDRQARPTRVKVRKIRKRVEVVQLT